MFSRRKLFEMIGLGSAAIVTTKVLPAVPPRAPTAAGLNWTAEELATLRSAGRPIVRLQQEINRRRSEMLRIVNTRWEPLPL